MMNVRKYRAGSTRDALELVKRDLGDDAFVLETKRVRSGGFLGLRSRMEIEVSAATGDALAGTETPVSTPGVPVPTERSVDIKDDAAAIPSFGEPESAANERRTNSALSSRAASAAAYEAQATAPAFSGTSKPETVEISSEAPRFIFPRGEKPASAIESARSAAVVAPEFRPAGTSDHELEQLRSEIREVKFSLANLASLQNETMQRAGAMDLGVFGENVDPKMNDTFMELIATGISTDLARAFVRGLAADLPPDHEMADPVRAALLCGLPTVAEFEPEVLSRDERTILAVIGSTGVGKTTTAAKLAARTALYDQKRVELVTLDTYRIAAVEQLKTYAEIIGAGCHVVRTVLELDAVLARLPKDAQILIDTTGRNPHDLADQFEFSDFLKRRSDIRKCLVVQATTHPADALAAIRKFEMYGADCLAITKTDETTRPGAIVETISQSRLPLAYLGTGQRVPEDLQVATAQSLSNCILAVRP